MNHDSRTYPFKFSIITAVYNVASYLSGAVESILCQDIGFKESVELILVDDGSTDSSGEICDHYQHYIHIILKCCTNQTEVLLLPGMPELHLHPEST